MAGEVENKIDGDVEKQQHSDRDKQQQPWHAKALDWLKNNWMLFIKVIFVKAGTYAFDIISDIVNGADYLKGKELPTDPSLDPEFCDDLKSYRHINWGAITIALTWMPGLIYLLGQGWFKYTQGKLTIPMFFGFLAMVPIWPFFIFYL